MLAIQPRCLGGAQEELGAVGAGSSVGHGEDTCKVLSSTAEWSNHALLTRAGVLQSEVLISELLAIDGLATGAVLPGEVATLRTRQQALDTTAATLDKRSQSSHLAHEARDDTVEWRASIAEALKW